MCKYCEIGKDFDTYSSEYTLEINQAEEKACLTITNYKEADHIVINFCPMCGRKLNEPS